MRTDQLIDALSRDPAPALPAMNALIARALAVGGLISLGLMLATVGVRREMAAATMQGWFVLKLALVALIALAGWKLASRAGKPGRSLQFGVLAAAVAAIALACFTDLWMLGTPGVGRRIIGDNALLCIVTIPFLSIAPLVAGFIAMRDGAPTRPTQAGAALGLLAGGIGGVMYGLHCTDDSPLFVAIWYVAGIGLVTLAGAAAGRRWLSW